MASDGLSNRHVFCSSCAKPWESTRYKTCDSCRGKAAQRRQRRAAAADGPLTPVSQQVLKPRPPLPLAPGLSGSSSSAPLNAINHQSQHQTLEPRPLLPLAPGLSGCSAPLNSIGRQSQQLFTPNFPSSGSFPCISGRKTPAPTPRTLYPEPKRRRTDDLDRQDSVLQRALHFLHQEFESRTVASNAFPPEISPKQVRASMARYESEISAAAQRGVCSSCGRLVPTADICPVENNNEILDRMKGHLDHCGRHGSTWDLCRSCLNSLIRHRDPELSSKNGVNVTMCQDYPHVLEDLTPVEECMIAGCHPFGMVLKLRPHGHSSPVNYHALRGHFIVIPQDPGPLLRILPSPELRLNDLIKVFWMGKHPPDDTDLRPFLVVRKSKVLAALQYLVRNNQIYKQQLAINYQMMDGWSDEFIPPELRDNVICVDESDCHEREGYTVNLHSGNHENDFQVAQDSASDAADGEPLITGSVSTDINGERQDPRVIMLNTLRAVVTNASQQANQQTSSAGTLKQQKLPSICYTSRGQRTPVDHWKDPYYFTAAFPTLFPQGIGGHLEQRDSPVSLASFAEWALKHHSRRFARHNTFMYLIYDVLQLRSSSLGNSLLIQRQNWEQTTDAIASLTEEQLVTAAEAMKSGQKVDDPLIRRLLHMIETIAVKVPGSFAEKLKLRAEIRGLIVRYGMPAFWITINPSDLQNPLVLVLAGIPYSGDIFTAANSKIRAAAATSNPAAVAEFFHYVCKAFFDGLLASNTGEIGVLGDISNHFGVVETNGRGMLHMHAMVWVRGNVAFASLRDRLIKDSDFATRMIRYLETTIMESLHQSVPQEPEVTLPTAGPSALDDESDLDFNLKLSRDSNSVASKKQMHSMSHSATCFKYQRNFKKKTCRFDMPRKLIPESTVDGIGVIHLARNNAWINSWNPAFASCLRSNHDISWIPTIAKSLSVMYYITNYATKDDISPSQIVAKAALLKQTIERAKATSAPTAADLRLREKGMDNFALRCLNALAHDREVSGVQVASTLLRLPSYYTNNYKFFRVNLWWLRKYIKGMIQHQGLENNNTSNNMGEELCPYATGTTAPISIFDNYRWRGPQLVSLSLYEYCMLVEARTMRSANTDDVHFDPAHPRSTTHMQHLARAPAQIATVTFSGQLTQFQEAEDSIPGGHPETEAIRNDLAEILLGLFVPWDDLPDLFRRHSTQQNPYARVWNMTEPTLSPHVRDYAANVGLLRKTKEDGLADAKLRGSAHTHDESFDCSIPDHHMADFGPDGDSLNETLQGHPEDFSAETLIAAYDSVTRIWDHELFTAAQRIPTLLQGNAETHEPRPIDPQPFNIDHTLAAENSGLTFFPPSTLENWMDRLKGFKKAQNDAVDPTVDPLSSHLDGFDLGDDESFLQPTIVDSDLALTIADYRSQLGENPSGASLTDLVCKIVPLNKKQRLVVEQVLSEALTWASPSYDVSSRPQRFVHVGGEGGTGKSYIVRASVIGMEMINRKEEVILMAPTGSAADKINGNTCHTSLGLSTAKKKNTNIKVSDRVRKLWANKTIAVIDEVSMVDLGMLSVINNTCKVARSLSRESTDFFGGLPIVILMGDFFQFPPVRGTPLWKQPRPGSDEEENGRMIWQLFKEIIILDEQMRQSGDPEFRDLLSRARAGALTESDVAQLNSKTVTSIVAPQLESSTAIVKLNSLRHQINRIRMENFAQSRGQRIFVFPALHTRTRSTAADFRLRLDDLLLQADDGSDIPFTGLFLYTHNMPVVLLSNICTLLGMVNGAAGTAINVVIDPNADFFILNDLYIMCTRPPACVLFKPNRPKPSPFQDLDPTVLPIFPLERSIKLKGYSIRRRQVPMCPAFCLTEYKVQGSTLTSAILDLKDTAKRGQNRHTKFCSKYVQLSRLETFDGVNLLQKISMEDVQFGPDPKLLLEMQRLLDLEKETLAAWQKD